MYRATLVLALGLLAQVAHGGGIGTLLGPPTCDEAFHFPPVATTTESTGNQDEVHAYLARLHAMSLFGDCNTHGSFEYYKKWYADRTPRHRLWALILGISVIVLGTGLPIVVHIPAIANYKLVVSAIGASIIIAQSISQTLDNDGSWQGYTLAQMKLEFAYTTWQHELIKAPPGHDGLLTMQAATECFSKSVARTVLDETSAFFTGRGESAVKKVPSAGAEVTSREASSGEGCTKS
jgi:hypothetical protein